MATTEPIKEIKGASPEVPVEQLEKKAPEIVKVQEDVQNRIGEQIYPKEKVPTFTSVRREMDAINAQNERVVQAIDRDPTFYEKLGTAIDHRKVAKSVTAVSIAQNQALTEKYKAGSADEKVKISEANQKRVEGYAGVIGNASKSILTSVGHGIGGFLVGLGSVAKGVIEGTIDLTGKALDKAWFGSWRAYHKYKQDKKAIKHTTK